MSLILMFFYWAVFPAAIIAGSWWLFVKSPSKPLKAGSIIIGLAVLGGYLWLAVGEVWMIDNKVQELCKKDGGITVYERVSIPKYLIDDYGRIKIPYKKDMTSEDPFYYEIKKHYFKKSHPEVSRREYRIIRQSDKKVLGKLIIYGRGGGGFVGPWFGSSFTCPEPSEITNFESQVFIAGDRNE